MAKIPATANKQKVLRDIRKTFPGSVVTTYNSRRFNRVAEEEIKISVKIPQNVWPNPQIKKIKKIVKKHHISKDPLTIAIFVDTPKDEDFDEFFINPRAYRTNV